MHTASPVLYSESGVFEVLNWQQLHVQAAFGVGFTASMSVMESLLHSSDQDLRKIGLLKHPSLPPLSVAASL